MPLEPLTAEQMKDVNPGVHRLVTLLRANGFDTFNSGDGATHLCECDPPFPFVACHAAPADMAAVADALLVFMQEQGILFTEIDPHEADDDDEITPWVEVQYDPLRKEAAVILGGVVDEDLPEVV